MRRSFYSVKLAFQCSLALPGLQHRFSVPKLIAASLRSTVTSHACELSPWTSPFEQPSINFLGALLLQFSCLTALPHSFQLFQLPWSLIFVTSAQQDHCALLAHYALFGRLSPGRCIAGVISQHSSSFLSVRRCSSHTIANIWKQWLPWFIFFFNGCLWHRESLLPDTSIRSLLEWQIQDDLLRATRGILLAT